MKRVMFFVVWMMFSLHSFAQQYRLVYDSLSIPELYDHTQVFAEVEDGNKFRRLPAGKYKLTTSEATLHSNDLRYNRSSVYANNGIINFTLHINNKRIPLTLTLPILADIRINSYTDSIKPILNYYLNVEGVYTSGKIYPLDTGFVTVTSDVGTMNGLEWVLPKERHFEKVHFTATNKFRPANKKSATMYLKKYKDPKDAPDYQDKTEEEVIRGSRRPR